MAFPDDVLPTEDRCEICGAELQDEIVIQEFADGSLARLCPECAAGADVSKRDDVRNESTGIVWPTEPADAPAVQPADIDPLERTRELLMPVTDLIALQGEMQSALERLAASLERFAAEVITESQDKTEVESRLQVLEEELDKTRARLNETDWELKATGVPAGESAGSPASAPLAAQSAQVAATVTTPATPEEAERVPAEPVLATPADTETVQLVAPPQGAPTAPSPAVVSVTAPPEQTQVDDPSGFRIEEVQSVQRYFNESPFTGRIRDVRRSLGRPEVNLTRVPGAESRAIVTVAWNIVWYQYLVDLRRDAPASEERVVLHREGMDLDELDHYFKAKNSVVNDDGRLDASELEVRLLSDPAALITEMTPEEKQLLEDATEEIWDHRTAPEFKWDD